MLSDGVYDCLTSTLDTHAQLKRGKGTVGSVARSRGISNVVTLRRLRWAGVPHSSSDKREGWHRRGGMVGSCLRQECLQNRLVMSVLELHDLGRGNKQLLSDDLAEDLKDQGRSHWEKI